MIKVRFNGFVKDQNSRDEINNGSGWVEWRVLDLVDESGVNPEWFYIAACNQYYFDQVVKPSDAAKNTYVVQEEFDESQLLSLAKEFFSKLTFSDWDDFYSKMSKQFIYEDD